MSVTRHIVDDAGGRFEFRVWNRVGEFGSRLATLADHERLECIEDRYLLLGSRAHNAKIRRNRLKLKHLIEERAGFQRWSVVSCPIEWAVERVAGVERVSRPALDPDLPGGPARLLEPWLSAGLSRAEVRTVTVTKSRRRFRVGSIRAESSDVAISGRPGWCTTVAIKGTDLADLIALRHELGLDHRANVGYHLAIDPLQGLLDGLLAD